MKNSLESGIIENSNFENNRDPWIVVVAGVAVFTSYLLGGIISVLTWICHSCYVDLLKLAIMATMIVVVAALHIFSPGRDQLCSSFSSPPKNVSAPVQNL